MVKCPECGAEEKTAQHLVGHRQWKHHIHVCPECHVEVKSGLTLAEHTLAKHGNYQEGGPRPVLMSPDMGMILLIGFLCVVALLYVCSGGSL